MFADQENRPLLRSLSEASVNRIWFAVIVGVLVGLWCMLDSFSHSTIATIFKTSEVKDQIMNPFTGQTELELQPFNYVLTLAFLQFAFMAFVFCLLFAFTTVCTGDFLKSFERIRPAVSDGTFPALVGTHMFGSFLVQSLVMPTALMSLGLFAATRAVEVPVAAAVRAKVFGSQFGGHAPVTTGLMFAAAWLMFYSHTQIAECLCVWSGFGVALSGLPLYFVYALLLTIPATNVVLQESMLVQSHLNPMLMQGMQNLCAAILFVPILIGAHWCGHENVKDALVMITGHIEIYMSVLWLCMQTAILSALTVGLIWMVDSFWTVAARSLRVVFWWAQQLMPFYLMNDTLLSVARPHASLWSFGMVCGICLGVCALVTDSRPKEFYADKQPFASDSFGIKYV